MERRSATVVIFGASGDLTRRKLAPALHSLACEGLLPPGTWVIGVARTPLSDASFRDRLYGGVVEYARLKPGPDICGLWSRFAGRYTYLVGDYADPETYRWLAHRIAGTGDGDVLFYLATPPILYPVILEGVARAGLNRSDRGWRRVVIEKPFGHDKVKVLRAVRPTAEGVRAQYRGYRPPVGCGQPGEARPGWWTGQQRKALRESSGSTGLP